MADQDPTPDAPPPPWLATFEGDAPTASAADAGPSLWATVRSFGLHLAVFVGVGLVAAGPPLLAVVGVLVAVGALLAPDPPGREPAVLARAGAEAAALVVGLGLLVGGVQRLGEPSAAVLVPAGVLLSCLAFAVRRGFPLRGATGSSVIAGACVAAFVLHHAAAAVVPAAPAQAAAAAPKRATEKPPATDEHAGDEGHVGEDEHAAAKDDHAPAKDEHAESDDHAAKDRHAAPSGDHAPAKDAEPEANAGARGFTFLSAEDEREIAALERAARRAALGGR